MSSFAGTGNLVRLALRLDRVRLTIWVVAIAGLTYSTASAFRELYPTVQSRTAFSATLANTPALVALTGPPFDLRTIGGLTAWRIGGFGSVLLALLGAFTVVRHTRAEEENGRVELIGAGSVGRYAPLSAALVVAFGACLVVGLSIAVSLISLGETAAGAMAMGLGFAGSGWMFASLAALASQLTASARVANGIVGGLLGLAFAFRAIGDSASEGGPKWLSWLSPIGWIQQIRPFAGERWWVFGLIACVGGLSACGAYLLAARRDMGAGLFPERPGPGSASPSLSSPLALAWRIDKGPLASWTVGLGFMGAAFGTIAESIGSLLDDNPQLKEIFEAMGGPQNLTDAFFASVMGVVGLLGGAYAVETTLRLRAEEVRFRAEVVLATRATRTQWALSHLAIAAAGSTVILLVAGLATGVVHGLATGDVAGPVAKLFAAGIVQLPAILVLVGVTVVLFGFAPRWSLAAWAALAVFFVIAQLGPLLQLDQWVLDLSPYNHVPQIPGEEFRLNPVLVLMAVAAGLIGGGLIGFRRRDIG